MNRHLTLLLVCAWLTACSSQLPPPLTLDLQTPRPFGYVIGDEIHHRLRIQTRKDVKLVQTSVPAKGSVNRWLELNRVDVQSDADSGHTVIDLTYQVFYAPNEVKMLNIPSFALTFTQAGKTLEHPVPAWPFTLSPLKELAVRKDDNGQHYIRPDAQPALLPTQTHWLTLQASLALATGIGGYLVYRYGYFPLLPKRRLFKQAMSQLKRLPDEATEQALAVLHHAFNTLNGQPLFKHTLAEFYQRQPHYRVITQDIERFFDLSNRVLFGGQNHIERATLIALCQQCRDIECGKR
ncbi:MAG: nonribosomal peptide synthetase MxaA [Methylomonas sp.]|nr:nonribosomal peptide synthetase MxaA [Methylomonas sp.]PPD20215.1 MAG: nonribosomal peptide synthetase MxaA [Methylomonas sp.]PPD26266.1 MAG: nonribosomal peptide synthetase MxaA [Methylomonas sp.]PPD37983.1 MAG: nonribosomal peptide synthetase MxaA [Methylomonas sp.]PPD40365.1 MAG: nonribosomal peptide synthetase MxaA [Methylomonas sp.]